MSAFLDAHYRQVARAFLDGRVVPLLGAGVNLCGRPTGVGWQRGRYLPSGTELAAHLADYFDYPPGELEDLLRVSEYVSVVTGEGPLYPLIVTTNYDDALERAFQEAGEAFDLVVYIAEGDACGKFLHCAPDSKSQLIERPNKYVAIAPSQRPAILKIHGAIDRKLPENDSFVITEDHYIDYLTRTDLTNLIPVPLVVKLRRSHFLFLGYSMRDWNLRVILHRIWGQQTLSYKSWAIQVDPDRIEQEFWHKRGVDILNIRLEDYVAELSDQLQGVLQEQTS